MDSGRTEDIDLFELFRDAVEEGRDLLFVTHVQRDGGELSTGFNTSLLVCSNTRVRDLLQSIGSACAQDNIRTCLKISSTTTSPRVQDMTYFGEEDRCSL